MVSHLRSALRSRGLTQQDLSALTGISYAAVRNAARLDGNPFLDDALRIARVLDVPIASLYTLAEHRKA